MDIGSKIKENVNLAELTTFKIGGPAKFLVEIEKPEELSRLREWANHQNLDIFFLGGGSNILVSDEGFDGLVVKLANNDLKINGKKVSCGAGANLPWVLQEVSDQGLSGLEWTAGIPGITLGGAIRGNAGAFGVSMSDIVKSVEVYDISRDEWKRFRHQDCLFDYRESVFKNRKELVIWEAELELTSASTSDIKDAIKKNVQKRISGQPRRPNAGSVFKNLTWEYLQQQAPDLAKKAQYEGVVKEGKVGTGWIIDHLDLERKQMGGAQVSKEHSNFIINAGDATALDVITLVSYIKQKARQYFNLQLQEEIQYVGF